MGRCPLPPPLFCGSAARFVVGGANHLLSVAKASLHVAPSLFGHQKFEREADLGRDLRQLNNFSAASGATQSTRNNKVKQLVNGAVQGVAYGHSRLLPATARSLRGRSGRRRLALVPFRRGHARHLFEVFFGVDDASAEVPPLRTRAALIDEVSAEGGELFLQVVVVLLDPSRDPGTPGRWGLVCNAWHVKFHMNHLNQGARKIFTLCCPALRWVSVLTYGGV